MTKRELVARILAGPAVLETEGVVRWFRLSLPRDRARERYILIALAPELASMVEEYDEDHAFACLGGGKTARLTPAEADQIAAFIRRRVHVQGVGGSARSQDRHSPRPRQVQRPVGGALQLGDVVQRRGDRRLTRINRSLADIQVSRIGVVSRLLRVFR